VDLYLAGEGPQLAALKAMATANGLTDRVHFLGSVAKDQIHLWMAAADVLVLPSYSEGRPNVVLEAMATGTPVVATSVNGTTELISDDEDGLLFKSGDIAGLADCLKRLVDQPDLAAKLSIGGPEKIRTRGLSWLGHGRQLLSIYHQVLGGR
jgi:glycosyltransferase involved in cell wall biosynthesis